MQEINRIVLRILAIIVCFIGLIIVKEMTFVWVILISSNLLLLGQDVVCQYQQYHPSNK